MRVKDHRQMMRSLTDPLNIPKLRALLEAHPVLTQEEFKARQSYKPGGLVEPGVTHYGKVTDAEKKVNREKYLKKTNQTMDDFKKFSKYKRSRINLGQRQGVGTGSGFTMDQMYPKLKARAIELLNEGEAPIDAAKKLEEEGIIKIRTSKAKPRPDRNDPPIRLKKEYKPFKEYFTDLLDAGELKIKKFPDPKSVVDMADMDKKIVKIFKKNPDLQADRLARLISTQLGEEIGPTRVLKALKRSGIEYETLFKKIFPEIKALDKIVKNNARFLSGNASISDKNKFLFEAFKKEIKNKDFDPGHFANRLKRLGNLYAGTAKDVEKYKTTTELYKTIKPPKNYIDSHLHKNIVGMLSKEVRGIVSKAELLGLPDKEIQLLKDLQRGTGELAGDISIHGDHTDIDALMKNFDDYRKNFTRINYITANLNNLKSKTDTAIFNLFQEADELGNNRSPGAIKRRSEIMDEVAELRRSFTADTGLKIGGFKVNPQTGKMAMELTTPRLIDIDSPRWTKLKEVAEHLDQRPKNVFDQMIMKLKGTEEGLNSKKLEELLTKWKSSPELKNSQFIKSFSRMGGKYGKLAAKLIGGTIGAGGIAVLATAGTTREKGLTTEEMKGRRSEMSMVPKIIKENPYTSAAVGTGAALTQKPVRSLLGKTFRTLGTPLSGLGWAGFNVYDKMKEGKSLADAVVDPLTGVELAFPSLFKENVAKITKSPTLQKVLGLGKFGSRVMPGVGTAITLGSLTRDGVRAINKESQRIDAIEDPDQQLAEQDILIRNIKGYAGGGIAGLLKK